MPNSERARLPDGHHLQGGARAEASINDPPHDLLEVRCTLLASLGRLHDKSRARGEFAAARGGGYSAPISRGRACRRAQRVGVRLGVIRARGRLPDEPRAAATTGRFIGAEACCARRHAGGAGRPKPGGQARLARVTPSRELLDHFLPRSVWGDAQPTSEQGGWSFRWLQPCRVLRGASENERESAAFRRLSGGPRERRLRPRLDSIARSSPRERRTTPAPPTASGAAAAVGPAAPGEESRSVCKS